jgi:hypothetical protein
MKDIARQTAPRNSGLSLEQARSIILNLCREEHTDLPPEFALSFLSKELVSMVEMYQNERPELRSGLLER